MIKITILGSGSIIPVKDRFSSGVLIGIGGDKLLMDCGPGVMHKLSLMDVDPNDIGYFFLSHFHIDHVSDYLGLVKVRAFNRSGGKGQPNPMHVFGPPGLKEFNEEMFKTFRWFRYVSEHMNCFAYLNLKEVWQGRVHSTESWEASSTPVRHYEGVAYRLDTATGSVVYSGDTVPDENLAKLASDADILIHECSFPDEQLLGLHTGPRALGEIAARSRVKRLVATHLYPVWAGKEEELVMEIRRNYDGEVIVGEDLLEITA